MQDTESWIPACKGMTEERRVSWEGSFTLNPTWFRVGSWHLDFEFI